jgi:hypothetical protein
MNGASDVSRTNLQRARCSTAHHVPTHDTGTSARLPSGGADGAEGCGRSKPRQTTAGVRACAHARACVHVLKS